MFKLHFFEVSTTREPLYTILSFFFPFSLFTSFFFQHQRWKFLWVTKRTIFWFYGLGPPAVTYLACWKAETLNIGGFFVLCGCTHSLFLPQTLIRSESCAVRVQLRLTVLGSNDNGPADLSPGGSLCPLFLIRLLILLLGLYFTG